LRQVQQQATPPPGLCTGFLVEGGECPLVEQRCIVERELARSLLRRPHPGFDCPSTSARPYHAQVVGELCPRRLSPCGRQTLERPRPVEMEALPPVRRKAVVELLAGEHVHEAVGSGGDRLHHRRRLCPAHRVLSVDKIAPGQRSQIGRAKLSANDRGHREKVPGVGGQGRDTLANRRSHAVRNGHDLATLEPRQVSASHDQAECFGHEQWVAVRGRVERGHRPSSRWRAGYELDELGHFLSIEPTEAHHPGLASRLPQQRRPILEIGLAHTMGRDDHHRHRPHQRRQKLQEQQRRRVRGMDVVKNEELRPARCQGAHQAHEGIHEQE